MINEKTEVMHFEVPALDLSIPKAHMVMSATAMLVDHLDEAGLLALEEPKWQLTVDHKMFVTDIKVEAAEPDAPEPVTAKGAVICPKCFHRFETY